MKYTKIAMEKSKYKDKSRELSLLERVLEIDDSRDGNLASVLALDLFLVGIDTVSVNFNRSFN